MEKAIVSINQVLEKKAWHFPIFSAKARAAEDALESSNYPLVPLRELVKRTGRGFPRMGRSQFEVSDVPLLSIRNITSEGIDLRDTSKFISSSEHEKLSKSAVQKNDVLVALTVASKGNIVAVYEDDSPANLTSHIALLKLDEARLNPHYLVEFLNSSIGRSLLAQRSTGSIQRSITLSQLLSIVIPLPLLSEQKRLVQAVREKRLQANEQEQKAIKLRKEADELVETFLRSER